MAERTPRQTPRKGAAQAAIAAAKRHLVSAHLAEFRRYHREERIKRGLPAEASASAEVMRLRSEVAELERQLQEARGG